MNLCSPQTRVRESKDQIKTLSDVWVLSREIARNFTLGFLHKLYKSLPERIELVIKNGGNKIVHWSVFYYSKYCNAFISALKNHKQNRIRIEEIFPYREKSSL